MSHYVIPENPQHLVAVPGKPQGVALPESKVPGYSAVYRNAEFKDALAERMHSTIRTVYDIFEVGCLKNPETPCLGKREYNADKKAWGPYIWQTYGEVRVRRDQFGAGIMHLHHAVANLPNDRQFGIGIWANNCPEWQITDLACQAQALYSVALYDTLGADASEYIIKLCELTMVVSSLEHIPTLLRLKGSLPSLRFIVCTDSLSEKTDLPGQSKGSLLRVWGETKGVEIYSMQEVEQLGQRYPRLANSPQPSDILSLCFTSGTTGMPKGAVLTHANAVASLASNTYQLPSTQSGVPDVLISYLPLAHIYERIAELMAFYSNRSIGYFHGNTLELLEDIQELKPTMFPSVPRLLNRIAAAIKASTIHAPGVKGAISRRAYAAKLQSLNAGNGPNHMLWDRLWSRKIQQVLGGRVRMIISGAAPIGADALQFLRAALACDIVEGYGMTENFAVSNVSMVGDYNSPGVVGPPSPSIECRLRDVPDMHYTSDDKPNPRGELMVRGPNVFQGYYKEEAKTKESFDSDGWFHTGDIAEVDSLGRFRIIDRVKNFFKLAQGEYIAPEKIENIYLASNLLAQIFVHGDSHHAHLVAVVGVAPDTFAPFASRVLGTSVQPDKASIEKAGRELKVKKALLKELERFADKGKLHGFEKIKNVYVTVEPFTMDDALTPTMKIKRNEAVKLYRNQLDRLYAEELGQGSVMKSKL